MILKCFDEYVDGFTISDELRKVGYLRFVVAVQYSPNEYHDSYGGVSTNPTMKGRIYFAMFAVSFRKTMYIPQVN